MDISGPGGRITDEWVECHFDHLSPELARELHPTLARARSLCPVAHSDAYGGFWVATRYEDVLRVAQDWETFSSELGIGVPAPPSQMKILPVTIDPPLQRTFKRLVNTQFTPAGRPGMTGRSTAAGSRRGSR
jgi:cytochrome P450